MHDRRHGEGNLTRADGSRYSGSWKHDKTQGYGVKVFGDGDVYKGEFVLGLFHGAGRYEHSNGEVYSGQYVQGSAQGKGSYSWPSGDLYEGEFFSRDFRILFSDCFPRSNAAQVEDWKSAVIEIVRHIDERGVQPRSNMVTWWW
jgi:hypothetical protein